MINLYGKDTFRYDGPHNVPNMPSQKREIIPP